MTAQFKQRMPNDLHERIKKLAEEYGVSMNSLINMACEEFEKTGRLDDLESRVTELEKRNQEKKNGC